jgi:hypothetical protein
LKLIFITYTNLLSSLKSLVRCVVAKGGREIGLQSKTQVKKVVSDSLLKTSAWLVNAEELTNAPL